ncbi:hypothetical protein HCN44_006393 [Aphidius gifuensis]|uniref:Crossover junction endonuclease EME1 n=1 Tax=Aphidius gifuensis TaxID=684658 RepID=A0A835CTJ1_APHGI|nr:probable crossover junction endonuclease EME2 [Aphidius gifuensis]KAF7993333.1 hypothetical protein HCN44_006393 [Aphidius gifuensis]
MKMDTIICLSDSDKSNDSLIFSQKQQSQNTPSSPVNHYNYDDIEIDDLPVLNIPSNYSPLRRKISPVCSPIKTKITQDKNEPVKTKKKTRQPKPIDEEKLKRQRDAKIEKLEKKIALMIQKNSKPGECMKFIKVELDETLKSFDFYQQSLSELIGAGVSFKEVSMMIPNSIKWIKINEEYSIDEKEINIQTKKQEEEENLVLIIWDVEYVVKLFNDNELSSTIINISKILTNKRLSIIIYHLEDYFLAKKNAGGKKKEQQYFKDLKKLPKIDRNLFEITLVELQLEINCNFRLIDDFEEISLVIYQYTKSFAEIDYKKNEAAIMEEMDFYAAGENRDTVGVDKDGNGLKNLWIKQLCMFNAVGLSTAEAICSVYPSPVALMNAFVNCSIEEGEALLKDIPIKRADDPLATHRKIGPELSKKLHRMFTSEDGEKLLF